MAGGDAEAELETDWVTEEPARRRATDDRLDHVVW